MTKAKKILTQNKYSDQLPIEVKILLVYCTITLAVVIAMVIFYPC